MRITKELLSGLLFTAIGAGAALIALSYPMGVARVIGPGFFPLALGICICLVGISLSIKAWRDSANLSPVEPIRLRPIFFILIAPVVFALCIRPLGLIPSLVLLIGITRLATAEGSMKELAVMLVALCVIAVLIFDIGLGIPFRLWPTYWS